MTELQIIGWCNKCEQPLRTTTDVAGAMMVTFHSPLMADDSPPIVLCHNCARLAAEFMMPTLKESPTWEAANREV